MARLKPSNKRDRAGKERRVPSAITVVRLNKYSHAPFEACLRIGSTTPRTSNLNNRWYCAPGKNPRKALANVLRKAASIISTRKGAFAGRR